MRVLIMVWTILIIGLAVIIVRDNIGEGNENQD